MNTATTTYEEIDPETMTTEELRKEFAMLRRNAGVAASRDEWMDQVKMELRRVGGSPPSPADWVRAARVARVECDRCYGSGEYHWGPVVNGKTSHSGPCHRCQGTGVQGQDDFRRNWGYDRYAVVKAFREMVG
jgi:hypothetical protein